MLKRALNLFNRLGSSQSAMLFGPRGAGKTALCHQFLAESGDPAVIVDLLDRETFKQHADQPGLLKSILHAQAKKETFTNVLIDEVQKIPEIMDDVHSTIEEDFKLGKKRFRFIVTGSSARKLKRGGANLLAGRAITMRLYPLTILETPIIENRALLTGLLPAFYLKDEDPIPNLRSYAETYIKEEVLQEALVRNNLAFTKFIELAAQMNGEPINYSRIAKAARVSTNTIQSYFEILEDILLVRRLDVWSYSVRAQMIAQPKYYFFDCGVLNALRSELSVPVSTGTYRYGKLFETLVINQIAAAIDYLEYEKKMYFWRTKGGAEVDLLLSRGPGDTPTAIEIKSEQTPDPSTLRGLKSFSQEYPEAKLFCLCNTTSRFKRDNIEFLPWREGILAVLEG